MAENIKNNYEDDEDYPHSDQSYADQLMEYKDIIKDSIFLGDYPFETIIEGLKEQFNDYINIEDNTNYVDIFYVQWENSCNAVKEDEENIHMDDELEVLDDMKTKFIDIMFDLFKTRLALTIKAVDDEETPDVDELEICIRSTYEFFILNARKVFRTVLARDISTKIPSGLDEESLFRTANEIININYIPLIVMKPDTFLEYAGNEDVKELYEEMQITGNFLRKYTPKLYKNEDLIVDIIADIDIVETVKQGLNDTEGL